MNTEQLRNDFPLCDRKKRKLLYLDSACVSLKPRHVLDAMREYYEEFPACAGRSSHRLGEEVTRRFEDARKTLAKFFGVKGGQLIFTRNTTEGINLVAHSFPFGKKGCVLTTDKEHNSNLLPWLRLKEQGITHKVLPTSDEGVDLEAYERLLQEGVRLVAVHSASNVDGMSLPVREMARLAHAHGARILVDGAQSAGHREIDVRAWDVDFFACSGHKMLGPSGTGILLGKKEALEELSPFLLGGETVKETWIDRYELEEIPHRFEAGLQDYGGMIGLAEAARYLERVGLGRIEKHVSGLNEALTEALSPFNLRILGNASPGKRGSVTSVIPGKMDVHGLNGLLDSAGILTRSGAFCAHSWFNARKLRGAVRLSLHLYNTAEEIEKISSFFRKIGPLL